MGSLNSRFNSPFPVEQEDREKKSTLLGSNSISRAILDF